MNKSIASKVALAMLAGAAAQTVIAADQAPTTLTTDTAQTASQHSCAQKLGGKSCQRERCFGIAKKNMNDCGTSKHACAAQAKADNEPDEWIFVLKGNCKRINGGSTKP